MAENNYYINGDTVIFNDGVKTIEYDDLHIVDKPVERSKFEIAMKVLSPNSNIKAGLEDIKNVILSSGVTSIGDKAFEWCKSFESITIPDSVTSIGERAFRHCSFEDITIPDSVTNIGKDAFAFCENLEHITIPNSVTSISDYTFRGCTHLKSITIPDSVINIGKDVFNFCGNLTIKCNKGSYAEEYAKVRNIPVEYLEDKPSRKSNKKDNIERE